MTSPTTADAEQRLIRLRRRLDGLAFGGDYNPEQWSAETWKQDARLMREAGVNLVTVGVFSWGLLEPKPGIFTFDWLDEVLDLLADAGVSVDLATPTAAPPSWLAREHPEILPVDGEGRRIDFGSRCHYCQSSPVFRQHAARITEQLAARYSEHPALAMWHVGNEYIGFGCHCRASVAHFRRWLSDRYHDDIGALNEAWGTAFWGQHYESFEHVGPPAPRTRLISGPNPGQLLDFARFSDAAALECYLAERDILRAHTPEVPITTNFMASFKHLDYWRWAAEEDVVSLDIYPDPQDPRSAAFAAYNFDLMRSLRGGKPWLLLESATSNNLVGTRNYSRPAGQLRSRSLQAVARGADSVMFFQWRASRAGAERFHSAMLPHGGTQTRTWSEVKALGEEVRSLADLAGGVCDPADVAMVWDWESWWALEGPDHPSNEIDFTARILDHYQPLWGANIPVDFVRPHDELSGYKLVVIPNLYLVDDAGAENIARYVRAGGNVLISHFSGIVDEYDRVRPDGHPGAFRDLLGIRIDEFSPMPADATQGLYYAGTTGTAAQWQDVIELDGAEQVAAYTDGEFKGRAAATRHRHGEGVATYLGTTPDEQTMRRLVLDCVTAAGAAAVLDTPEGVEASRRRAADGTERLFLINHTAEEVAVDLDASNSLTLAPYDVAVLRDF